MATPEPRWVRLEDISKPDCGLSVDERISVLATALTELGIAQGLVLIHGPERGIERYEQLRGLVRADEESVWVRLA